MARKKQSEKPKKNAIPNAYIAGAGIVEEAKNYRYTGKKLYALRHERHHFPCTAGDRRLQAFSPETAVHHV